MNQKIVYVLSRKYLIIGLVLLTACSFQADDYEPSGLKATTDIALPLAFGEITIFDIIERQYSPQKILLMAVLLPATTIVLSWTIQLIWI